MVVPPVGAEGVPPVRDARTFVIVPASAPNEVRSEMIASTCEVDNAALAVCAPTPATSVSESMTPRTPARIFFDLDLCVICMINIKVFDLRFDFVRTLCHDVGRDISFLACRNKGHHRCGVPHAMLPFLFDFDTPL